MPKKLSKSITETEFNNGYWYATDLKAFAEKLGIPSPGKLRKDQLEAEIKYFLATGKIKSVAPWLSHGTKVFKDVQGQLTAKTVIKNYTSNRTTKDFLLGEAKRMDSQFSQRPDVGTA